MNQYSREMQRGARNLRRFESAWEGYVNALADEGELLDHPDGRTRRAAIRRRRAAYRNLNRVCAAIGVECPL